MISFQNESVLDLADMDPGDQVVLDMADHPPAPTTAASDGLESAITIYTPGKLICAKNSNNGLPLRFEAGNLGTVIEVRVCFCTVVF